jgi:spectinomycin phosphotransferase
VEESGDYQRPEDRRLIGALVGRLHAASGLVPAGLPGREDFALPGRAALEAGLAQLDTPWNGGPFGELARALLRAHAGSVRERLRAFDRVAPRLRDEPTAWAVTHGEPHSANVIREPGGGLRLVDWDTTLVAPRERDLWMVLDDDLTGWDEYRAVAGSDRLDEDLLGFYKERWALAEIGMYMAEFRRPHEETDDTHTSWKELGEYLR